MIKLLTDNPYRILGVYSNSPQKDVLANLNKAKAFVKVGKAIEFPLDLPNILPDLKRDAIAFDSAKAAILLPIDRIKHTVFWFMNATSFDKIAFNHLSTDITKAKDVWSKNENVSSLQNLMVCAMIEDDIAGIAVNADKLFNNYAAEYCKMVDETLKLSSVELIDIFVNAIRSDGSFDIPQLAQVPGTSAIWRNTLKENLTGPIIDKIDYAVNEAKSVKGSAANYNAGVKLMKSTKKSLIKLRNLIGTSDMQYQMTADKLATTILQCSINYVNDSEDNDAPHKAMTLQSYALSIAVGQLAKDRCQENVNILTQIIAELPPIEVETEAVIINEKLQQFSYLPNRIAHSVRLLQNCKPLLNSIAYKVGKTNPYYLKISTHVVGNALHKIIAEVNASTSTRSTLKSAVKKAWYATMLMDDFDMENNFRTEIYNPNKAKLREIYDHIIGASNGWVAYWIGVIICAVIGAMISKGEGFITGGLIGTFTVGPILKSLKL